MGFPAGSGVDVVARMLQPSLEQSLGQRLVIDYKPGAGGNVASELVARAGADGYTFLLGTAATHGVNAALYKTTCFGVSALYAGVAGGLSAIAVGFVSPESFGLPLSLAFLVGIVVGGLASLGGVLFGALFIEFVPNIADQLTVS